MPTIRLITPVAASVERCFDLSRDIDLHVRSMVHTGERAVGGRTSGLIGPDEFVTWRGRHFGLVLEHTSRITAFDRPHHFQDSMVVGRFQRFVHDHFFEAQGSGTVIRDLLEFEAPFGWVGRLTESMFLKRHLIRLLAQRNAAIKRVAERT